MTKKQIREHKIGNQTRKAYYMNGGQTPSLVPCSKFPQDGRHTQTGQRVAIQTLKTKPQK